MDSDQKHCHQSGINRRRFIQGTGAFVFTLAAVPFSPRFSIAADKNILRVRDYGDFQSLDPGIASNLYEENITSTIYNKLIAYKPGNKWEWQLQAAEEIEQLDPTHIRFKLKPGIQFTRGFGEMTAEDVKYSYERIIDPELKSPIKGDWEPLKEVQVKDKYTGIIVLKTPFQALWMTTLPYMAGNIISKKATESVGGQYSTKPPCCSGPYVLKSWTPKQKTVLAKNPEWTGEPPEFEEIHIFPIDDEKTAEIAFEAGDLDWTRISLSSYPQMKANPPKGSVVKNHPSLYYAWIGMNLENPALKDKRVRQAVQYAIDVPSILDAAYFGVADPATGYVPPGLIGHRPKNIIPRESMIDKAKLLLKEAGHGGGIDLTMDVRNKAAHLTVAQVVQATLAAAGIRIQINQHDSGSFWSLGDQSKGDRWKKIQLIFNRFSSAPDPYYAAQWFTKEQVGIWNWERFKNEEYNELHKKAAVESDPEKRGQMYRRMQDLMEKSGAYHFITHEANPVIFRDTIVPAMRPDGLPLLRYFKKA
jgi:peptide/nickel transport system substrate-binding protein